MLFRSPATVAPGDATPTPLPTTPPAPTPVIYVVGKGDTISKIARKNHVTVEQLLAANPKIKNPDRIKVGDAITIPIPEPDSGGSAAPSTRSRVPRRARVSARTASG